MRAARNVLTPFALLASLTACEQVSSLDVPTASMHADIEVSTRGRGETRVTAELRTGALTWVDLHPDDRLIAFAAGEARALAPIATAFDDQRYTAVLPVDFDDAPVSVELRRRDWPGAPDSVAWLPPRFRLYADRHEPSLAYDGLYFEWDFPADEPMHVSIEGPCVRDWSTTMTLDPGALFVPPGVLVSRWAEGCDLDVRFERVRRGDLDPAFGEGSIVARQVREVVVPVLP